MLDRFKYLTIAASFVLAAASAQPALAKKKADTNEVAPAYSLLARGTSIDGSWATDVATWSWWGPSYTNNCSFCTDDSSCQCFFSDDSNGGSGIFQVNINQYTTMDWAMELDYTTYASMYSGNPWQPCYPASGAGSETNIGGSSANFLDYSTTGQLCVTPDGNNQTYTGSWIITDGGGLYADYQGAGTIGQGIYGRLPSEVTSQVEFNGQINPAPPTPSPLPTPSPCPSGAVATPTPAP